MAERFDDNGSSEDEALGKLVNGKSVDHDLVVTMLAEVRASRRLFNRGILVMAAIVTVSTGASVESCNRISEQVYTNTGVTREIQREIKDLTDRVDDHIAPPARKP